MEQTPPEKKRSKARERQQRRKVRKETKSSSSAWRSGRQITPVGGLKLPQFNMRYVRPVVLVGGAAIFMLVLIWAVGLFKNEPETVDPNAIWLGTDWTYQPHSDDDMRQLVNQLQDKRIGVVYAHVSELNFDGTWTGIPDQQNRFNEVQSAVSTFVEQFKRLAPNMDIYGTVIFRIDLDDDGYRLDDVAIQTTISEFSTHVVETLGFDGVLLQADPFVKDGDENFLQLIRQVRQSIGKDALLAITIPPDWTPSEEGVPSPTSMEPTVWDRRYKRRVALLQLDQMIVRAYDSSLITDKDFSANDYIEWVAYQTRTYIEAIASVETDTRLLVAVSTMDNIEFVHDVQVESIPAAVIGVRLGMEGLDEETLPVFQGIAIYADWTTNDMEWKQYEDGWLK